METRENYFTSEVGEYDTKKILNLAKFEIPAWVIEEIVEGDITSELLEELKEAYEIFRYKTCITIHGYFTGLEENMRVGGYQNLHRNKNGSLEIRYNAIDFKKKARIAEAVKIVDWRYQRTSTGDLFGLVVNYKTKEEHDAALDKLSSLQTTITKGDFCGKIRLERVTDTMMGVRYFLLTLQVRCLPESAVDDMILKMKSYMSAEEIVDKTIKQEAAKRLQDEQEEAMRIEHERQEVMREERRKKVHDKIAHLPVFNPRHQNKLGVRVTSIHGKWCFKFIQIIGKGGFGRSKWRFAFSADLDDKNLNWKQGAEIFLGDLLNTSLDFRELDKLSSSLDTTKMPYLKKSSDKPTERIGGIKIC